MDAKVQKKVVADDDWQSARDSFNHSLDDLIDDLVALRDGGGHLKDMDTFNMVKAHTYGSITKEIRTMVLSGDHHDMDRMIQLSNSVLRLDY